MSEVGSALYYINILAVLFFLILNDLSNYNTMKLQILFL